MKQIFINLPVQNVEESMNFYRQLGFSVNPLFTFDDQKCMVWGDQIFVMLQTVEMFQSGNKNSWIDPRKGTTATFTLPVDSVEQLNEIMKLGLEAGGKESTAPIKEEFMLVRNIEDLDGHIWGILCLDMKKFKELRGK